MRLADKIKAHPAVAHLWWAGSDRDGRWIVELHRGWEYTGPAFDAGIYGNHRVYGQHLGSLDVEAIRLRDIWTAVQAAKREEVTE